MKQLITLIPALLLFLALGCDDGGGGTEGGVDTMNGEDTALDTDSGDAWGQMDLVPEDTAPLTCEKKNTEVADSCIHGMLSCFNPAGACSDATEGFGWQWANGAKAILEGTVFVYYSAEGTACFSVSQGDPGSTFTDSATSLEYLIDSEAGTSCEMVTCADGGSEVLDSHDLDAAFFEGAGEECFE